MKEKVFQLLRNAVKKESFKISFKAPGQYKHDESPHLTFLSLGNLFDPVKIFWYVCVDVGYIRVVTVSLHVERHNTNSFSATHQRTPRITLWGGRHPNLLFVFWNLIPFRVDSIVHSITCSLNGEKTHLTESFLCVESTSTDNIVGKSKWYFIPFCFTDLQINKRHICHLQHSSNLTTSFC